MSRPVAVGNPREFTQTEKEEQEFAEACNRLTGDSIVCWNHLYLARRLERAPDAEMRENLPGAIGRRTPMSWAHINMLGECGEDAEGQASGGGRGVDGGTLAGENLEANPAPGQQKDSITAWSALTRW